MSSKSKKRPVEYTHNLSDHSLSDLAFAFRGLADQMQKMKAQHRSLDKIGRYNDCTVYRVPATVVRSYKRRGFIAVRIRNPR